MGCDRHISDDAAVDRLLLRLPLQDLLEETQGQGLQKRSQERRGSQKRPDSWQYS